MPGGGVKFPFDERNRRDFDALSIRLHQGLQRISSERHANGAWIYAPSARVLATLAECSLATIYARQGAEPIDPIAMLREVKAQRLAPPIQEVARVKRRLTINKDHLLSISVHVEDKIRLRRELCLALDEATRWNRKFMDGSQQKCSVDAQNARLIQKVVALEERVGNLTNQIKRLTDLRDSLPTTITATENKI